MTQKIVKDEAITTSSGLWRAPRVIQWGIEINRLIIQHGGYITPEQIVEAAKHPDSPLHDAFEWDVSKAAQAYWEVQAKWLIRHTHVIIEEGEDELVTMRVFQSVKTENGPRYTNIDVVMNDNGHRQDVVQQAYISLLQFRNKYQLYSEFFGVIAAIDEIELSHS